jgi:programmed cell death protein 5
LDFTDLKFPTTVANIAVVKPDKARKIEDMLIMNAQRGAFGGQISEEQLIQMLETITEKTKSSTKVFFHIIICIP